MIRKTMSAMLIFALLSLCLNVSAKTYPDVGENDSAYDAVDYLSDIGVVSGYEDGLFKADRHITRGEASALIARAIGFTEDYETKKTPFTDIKEGYWAERFISYCWERELVNGMGENLFIPADKVTYAQVVKMLVCASGLEEDAKDKEIENWYDGYIEVAQENGILEDVVILPNESAPRGDVAVLVYNCIKNGLIEDESAKTEEPDKTEEVDDYENSDSEESDEEIPEPTPTPAMVDKEDVLFDAEIDEDFEFSSVIDYTPEISKKDVDFSGIKKDSTDEPLLIVIDPGHNFDGRDVGAYNEENDVWEQYITWPIAEMLRLKLERMGFEVVMTKDNFNQNISGESLKETLLNRAGIANKLEADLFISIHCNAGGGKGVETYCYKEGTKAEKLATAVQDYLAEDTPLYDRGVKTAGFVVIKETLMPAILVETAFLDNEDDFSYLISNEGQNALSTAIAKGVLEYVNED